MRARAEGIMIIVLGIESEVLGNWQLPTVWKSTLFGRWTSPEAVALLPVLRNERGM